MLIVIKVYISCYCEMFCMDLITSSNILNDMRRLVIDLVQFMMWHLHDTVNPLYLASIIFSVFTPKVY